METENKKEQEDIQSKDKGTKERFERVFSIDSKKKKPYDENKRTVDIAFSSEEPYQRSFGMEILSHKSTDVKMDHEYTPRSKEAPWNEEEAGKAWASISIT